MRGLSALAGQESRVPLDYCSILCNQIRLRDPVNYIRANWIRPRTCITTRSRVRTFRLSNATPRRRFCLSGSRLLGTPLRRQSSRFGAELRLPKDKLGAVGKDAYSWKRMFKYFIKPRTINLLRFRKLIDFGHAASMLYPREAIIPS